MRTKKPGLTHVHSPSRVEEMMLPAHRSIDRIRRLSTRRPKPYVVALAVLATVAAFLVAPQQAQAAVPFPVESLDGGGNNTANPTWGQSNRPYLRVAPTAYADGISAPATGPNTRYVSNRLFNDSNQNLFSERRVTQWGWTWGQFLDHTFGLRQETGTGATQANIPFNSADPLERFTNDLGSIGFTRTATSPGTGTSTSNPRQQNNTTSTYINAFSVYGGTNTRLDWLRAGTLDGNPTNNSASLLLSNGYLPRRTARGNAATAPVMAVDGRLLANPNSAMVAGDVRANENIALTATHTLFAREHNRIVSLLPSTLSQEDKFQIARRIVIAEQQYITYNEWLPAMGVALPKYTGYKSNVNATLSNEFATVGYRVHSQIHGEFEIETNVSRYSAADLDFFRAQGVEVVVDGADVVLGIPLGVAFFNPDLMQRLQEGPLLSSLVESQYKNDEQIDNQLRSVLFQVPVSGNPDCLDGDTLPQCFRGVADLGAIDIERGRDHGIPKYNALRAAYGLPAKTSFTAITGESTDSFPAGSGVDNPNSLDITALRNIDGGPVPDPADDGPDRAVGETRRSTVAARLRGIYGSVNNVDAFAGMVAEPHVAGTEFGELQLAIWTRQFQNLRDGDRFFFGNDQGLSYILSTYGIDYRRTLGQIITGNTDLNEAADNVFLVDNDDLPATTCSVHYTVTTSWPGNFQVDMTITNTGATALTSWALRWEFNNGQTFTQVWNGIGSQSGARVTVTNASWNGTLNPGQSLGGVGFNATFDDFTNANPPNFTINNRRCSTV
jgi:hypothetical protein